MGSAVALGNQRQPSRFLSFPAELICKVLWHLDSQSLITIKSTCRGLYRATKSRQLWYNFIQYFELVAGTYPLEQPLTDYTVAELEEWVLHRLEIREQWQLPEPPMFHLREVDNEPLCEGTLLPGGRWLIGSLCEEFMVWDLEAPDPVPRVLFQLNRMCTEDEDFEHEHFSDAASTFTLWMDRSTHRLTFHIAFFNALYHESEEEEEEEGYTTILIYRVELEGHGAEAQFSCTRLITMCNNAAGNKHALLDGHRYIEMNTFPAHEPLVCEAPPPDVTAELHVYQYSDARKPSDVKVKILTTSLRTGGTLRTLSADYIGIETYSCILCVFAIAQLEESDPSSTVAPLYQIPLWLHAPLSPFSTPSSTFSFLARDSDRDELVIAEWFRDFSHPPIVRSIGGTTPTDFVAYGSSLTVFINEDSVEMLSYTWDENSGKYLAKRKCSQGLPEDLDIIHDRETEQFSVFDEISGRILARNLQSWIVLEVDVGEES